MVMMINKVLCEKGFFFKISVYEILRQISFTEERAVNGTAMPFTTVTDRKPTFYQLCIFRD